MISRFIITSGLILASFVTFSPKAFAQSVDVIFEGNIGEECSFANPVPGTVVIDYGQVAFADISSLAPGGVSGQVDVACNTSAQLEITDVRFVSFTPTNPDPLNPTIPPDPATLFAQAKVSNSQTSFSSGIPSGDPPLDLSVGNQTVEVDMWGDIVINEAGIYEFAVTLTIVP